MIQNINIELFKNTSATLNFIIKDSTNEVVNLTGFTGRFRVYNDVPQSTNIDILTKSLTIDDVYAGTCSVDLTDIETNIDELKYKYVLEFDTGSGEFTNYGFGNFDIVGDDSIRIQQIRSKYGLDFEHYVLKDAMKYAQQQILNNAYEFVKEEYSQKKQEILIDNFVMDSSFSYTIDATDISIIQYQTKTPYTVQDLSANVASINFSHPTGKTIITMDAEYPSDSTYKLKIEYHKGAVEFNEGLQNIRRVEELYTLINIFESLPIYKLQQGLSSRTINGITIDFDQDGIEKLISQLYLMVNKEIMTFRPWKFANVLIGKGY